MADSVRIAIKNKGVYKSIYSHWGFKGEMMPELRRYFSTEQKAKALIEGGNISGIWHGMVRSYATMIFKQKWIKIKPIYDFSLEKLIRRIGYLGGHYLYIFDTEKNYWEVIKL